MKPQLALPVRFVNRAGKYEAAIICHVESDTKVNLFAMHPESGCETHCSVALDETGSQPYSWHQL